MGNPASKKDQKSLQGAGRALVEALSLSHDRPVMDRIWDLLDDIEGPGHAAETRKRLLASNPSLATLQMLASRDQLYPLQDFITMLTAPGFMALVQVVGPAALVGKTGNKPSLLAQWLTRPAANLNGKQAVQLVDALANPATLDHVAEALWHGFFAGQALLHRAMLAPALLRVQEHKPAFLPRPSSCATWLKSSPYEHGRHRGALIDLMLDQVMVNSSIETSRNVAEGALYGFREAITMRDDDMACTSFKDKTTTSLNPRRLRRWLDAQGATHDPQVVGLFVGSLAYASACPSSVGRIAQRSIERAMPAASGLDLDVDGARQMMQRVVDVIMPPRKPGPPDALSSAFQTALSQRNEDAWRCVMTWSQGLPGGPARAMVAHMHAMATAPVEGDGYEARRQAVLMNLQTQAATPMSRTSKGPRF